MRGLSKHTVVIARPYADVTQLQQVFSRMIREVGLHPISDPVFPGPGGVTGLALRPLGVPHLSGVWFGVFESVLLRLVPRWTLKRLKEMLRRII